MTMCLNEDNSLLIVGDTMGYVYVWNIAKSKPTSSSGEFQEPVLVNAWHAHDNAIVCCQHIRERDSSVCNSELVVTTSTDWTCRLWRMDGAYVGAFGQENKWNLNEPHTYQSLVNLEDPGEKIKNLARSVACTEV
jgi:WD40 repeat protein